MKVARIYLWIGLAASILFGALYLIAPALVMRPMGIGHTTPEGLTDLRATYAGFQLGMAALLAWCLREESRVAAGLVAFACVVGGLALCRLFGLAIDGFSSSMATAATIEIAMSAIAIYLLTNLDPK